MAMKTTNLGDVLDSAAPSTYANIPLVRDTSIAVHYVVVGDPTALVADIEGSLDGETWGVVETHTFTAGELTALSALRYVTDKPMPHFRVKIASMTATTAATVTTVIRYND